MPIDVIKDWAELLPEKIIDARGMLLKHKTKKWTTRDVSKIIGICNHQVAGGDNPVETAKYHVKHFPARTPGAPGLCYTFYVRKNGELWWCNDIEAATWSQGYGPRPGSENDAFISIVSGGNFNGPGYSRGNQKLTDDQAETLVSTWSWLIKHLNLAATDLFGHFNFGKAPCPGYQIMALMDKYVSEHSTEPVVEQSVEWWQRVLVKLKYNLGRTGPNKDGVDGDWGGRSRAALTAFQKAAHIYQSGYRDDMTQKMLVHTLKERGIVL